MIGGRANLLCRDVVDTTSVNGNFIKMLLGAVRDDYDMEESDSDIEATC